MSTPQTKLKSKFESKEKLVAAVKALTTDELWIPRLNQDRGGNKGLDQVSNSKLLRLHETLSTVKAKFGTRVKLVDAVLEAEGRVKDTGYRSRLEAYTVPRLFDLYTAKNRKATAAKKAATAKTPAAAKAATAKKPAAAKAAAKKPAAAAKAPAKKTTAKKSSK